MNKRGQASDAGPIQGIILGLVLVIAVSIGFFNFLDKGLIDNYETPVLQDESAFTAYQEHQDNLTSSVTDIKNTLTAPGSGFTDITAGLVVGGFKVLKDFIGVPMQIAGSMITTAASAFGLPAESSLAGLAWFGLIIIIVFAILALIMKVRA